MSKTIAPTPQGIRGWRVSDPRPTFYLVNKARYMLAIMFRWCGFMMSVVSAFRTTCRFTCFVADVNIESHTSREHFMNALHDTVRGCTSRMSRECREAGKGTHCEDGKRSSLRGNPLIVAYHAQATRHHFDRSSLGSATSQRKSEREAWHEACPSRDTPALGLKWLSAWALIFVRNPSWILPMFNLG